jgi:hypothetical protein
MAAFALINEYIALSGTDKSAFFKSAVLTLDVAALDSTTMGDSWTEQTPGLKSGTLACTLNDDYAATTVDDFLFPLFGTVVTFEVRPVATGAVSATNPRYFGSVLINQHMLGGSVGDLAAKSGYSFPTSGAVTRATST